MARGGERKALIGTVVTLLVIGIVIFLAVWFTRKTAVSTSFPVKLRLPGQLCSPVIQSVTATAEPNNGLFMNVKVDMGCDYTPNDGEPLMYQINGTVDTDGGEGTLIVNGPVDQSSSTTWTFSLSGQTLKGPAHSGTLTVSIFGFTTPSFSFKV